MHHCLTTGVDYDEIAAWANWLTAGDAEPTDPTTAAEEILQEVA